MGSSSWSDDAYKHIKSDYKTKSTDDIFTNNKSKKVALEMNPFGIKFRESRDSDAHPLTLAVMFWLDVTGSMGRIPESMVREKLGTLMETLIKHNINDAQIFFGAIGDHISDSAPLQIGQFESGTEELNKYLSSIYIEGNGGGQCKESYLLAWLFAARHTSIDCFEKRGQKGILFTVGDEMSWDNIDGNSLKNIMGYTESEGISDKQLLLEAQRMYHIFHIHINEGSYENDPRVLGYWKELLNERLIILEDYNQISELVASTVAVIHGIDLKDVVSGFDPHTAKSISTALMNVNTSVAKKSDGVIKL